MKTLSERLRMITGKSDRGNPGWVNADYWDNADCGNAVTIDRRFDVNYYEILDKYCEDNNIDLSNVDDFDFASCAMWMEEYGSASPEIEFVTFWIAEE